MSNSLNYVICTTEINVIRGPTFIGNENSDPELMKSLGGELKPSNSMLGSLRYECPDDITTVINKACTLGFKVVGTTGLGQTFIVTLEKSAH